MGGIRFNSRKAFKNPFYLRVYLKYKAAHSEIDASINSGENREWALGLALFYSHCTGTAQEKKFSLRFCSEVSSGIILV